MHSSKMLMNGIFDPYVLWPLDHWHMGTPLPPASNRVKGLALLNHSQFFECTGECRSFERRSLTNCNLFTVKNTKYNKNKIISSVPSRCGVNKYPGVYARVSYYKGWINKRQKVQSMFFCPKQPRLEWPRLWRITMIY